MTKTREMFIRKAETLHQACLSDMYQAKRRLENAERILSFATDGTMDPNNCPCPLGNESANRVITESARVDILLDILCNEYHDARTVPNPV